MNLRRQLLLVSILTLILPWAGCQFIRETESALREGQQQMLAGTAQAIADSLSQFPDDMLAGNDDNPLGENQLYGQPLINPPLIDGYLDDWTIPENASATLRGTDGAIRYVVGIYGRHLFLHVDVRDTSVIYTDSTNVTPGNEYSDHVTLISVDSSGEQTAFRFRAEAPGQIVATRHIDNQVFDETRIVAHWQDTAKGYRLEAQIPRNLIGNRLGLTVTNTSSSSSPGIRSATFTGALPGPFVSMSPVLQSVANGYVQPGLRLMITNLTGWRLALAGNLSGSSVDKSTTETKSRWLRRAYNLLLEPGTEAALAEPNPGGREQQSYISDALRGKASSHWFRSPETGRAVISVAHPIWSGTVQTGAIVLQQGTDAILSLTNRALTRLITLTLISTIGVALVLLGYASWLSSRIRHLSSAAERALDDKRVRTALPSALAGDEVGDLSRSFSNVLRQLGNYNEYLRTLATKLSHELRTPLAIVSSSLENLEHENLSPEAVQYTARARDGAERLRRILTAMSEANRTEELIEHTEPEEFDIGTVLESTVAAYAGAWPERQFDLRNSSTAATVHGSPELIIQMLDKLADNAVEFSTPGDVITITLDADPQQVIIAVSNPGQPLPEKMRTQLFHSMVSVRRDDSGKHLGLGLYIARLIAEGHGGSIDAENTVEGVSFIIRIPTHAPTADQEPDR
jgi:two-component system sensor histidine kinase ChvG